MWSSGDYSKHGNLALELVYEAKSWTLQLIKARLASSASISTLFTWSSLEQPRVKSPVEACLVQLDYRLTERNAEEEDSYLQELKKHLKSLEPKLQEQVAFLVRFYEKMTLLAGGLADDNPKTLKSQDLLTHYCRIIIDLLKEHCKENEYLANASGIILARLDRQLRTKGEAFGLKTNTRLPTQVIEISIPSNPKNKETSFLPPTAAPATSPWQKRRKKKKKPPIQLKSPPATSSQNLLSSQTRSMPFTLERVLAKTSPSQGTASTASREEKFDLEEKPPQRTTNEPQLDYCNSLEDTKRSEETKTFSSPRRRETLHNLPPGTNTIPKPATLKVLGYAGLQNPTITLKKYISASEKYYGHLYLAVGSELEVCLKALPTHGLFDFLKVKNEPARTVSIALRNIYFSEPLTPFLSGYAARQSKIDKNQEILDGHIDDISTRLNRPQFRLAWEKFKILFQLKEARTVQKFHEILGDEKNKKILTTRRDDKFMHYVKVCGLVVASILGLPLGLVGGYLLAHFCLFGARATHGHIFINEINQRTKEGKKRLRQ